MIEKDFSLQTSKADCLDESSDEDKGKLEKIAEVDPKKSEEIWSSFLNDVKSTKVQQQPNKYVESEHATKTTGTAVKQSNTDDKKFVQSRLTAKAPALMELFDLKTAYVKTSDKAKWPVEYTQ
jgi:hypothetical protein